MAISPALPPGGHATVHSDFARDAAYNTAAQSLLCRGPQPICVIQTMALVLLPPPFPLPPPWPALPRAGKVHVTYLYV